MLGVEISAYVKGKNKNQLELEKEQGKLGETIQEKFRSFHS